MKSHLNSCPKHFVRHLTICDSDFSYHGWVELVVELQGCLLRLAGRLNTCYVDLRDERSHGILKRRNEGGIRVG